VQNINDDGGDFFILQNRFANVLLNPLVFPFKYQSNNTRSGNVIGRSQERLFSVIGTILRDTLKIN